ncbi:peptidoglycan editing factor PgeF [Pseudalkalibacillus decolorationis]|uniref:peptidoglycan editing factor PgeF n=1 Tax=Pseudalkalibacillus decolorationis TaxID=163879 RepID=UPI002147280B|nr:peptidoglycan editing factor PgeF [Pseudalkalibacillus decolorationis]
MEEPFLRTIKTHFNIVPFSSGYSESSIIAGISTRYGGVSLDPYDTLNLGLHVNDDSECVVENRHRLATDVGIPLERWVFAEQVHSSSIQKVTTDDCAKGSESYETGIMGVDGLYTNESNVVLSAAFADCVPLFFSSKQHSIVGIAHAGWKGSVLQIAEKMVNLWVQNECIRVEDIEVVIGPSIQSCCYEVDDRVINEVNKVVNKGEPTPYTFNHDGSYQLNLQQLNKQILIRNGISPENIRQSSHCTSCQVDDYFSHRKENGKTGRMLGFIVNCEQEGESAS